MLNHSVYRHSASFLAVAVLLATAQPAPAQDLGAPGLGGTTFGGNQAVLGEGDRVPKMEAGFTKPAADGTAQLFIVATMPDGAHTYSITQPDGGPIRTKIKVDTTAEVPEIGKFLTATKPKITHMEDAFPGVPLEEQSGKVKWFAPIKLAAGAKPESLKIAGKVAMQLCDDNGCVMPKDYAFTASYQPNAAAEKDSPPAKSETPATPAAMRAAPAAQPTKPAGPTGFIPRLNPGIVSIKKPSSRGFLSGGGRVAKVEAGFTAPGSDGSAQLYITATLPPGVNTYSLTQRTGPVATKIQVDPAADFSLTGRFASATAPEIVLNNPGFPGVPLEEHLGTVKWVVPIKLAPARGPNRSRSPAKWSCNCAKRNRAVCRRRSIPSRSILGRTFKRLCRPGIMAASKRVLNLPRQARLNPLLRRVPPLEEKSTGCRSLMPRTSDKLSIRRSLTSRASKRRP